VNAKECDCSLQSGQLSVTPCQSKRVYVQPPRAQNRYQVSKGRAGAMPSGPYDKLAGVVRFHSSLEGLTDKGREVFRKYREQFYTSDMLRSQVARLARFQLGRRR
jgi:hypothetical protein